MSGAHLSRVRVSCLLVDASTVCPTGGGFEKTEWSVRANDGWFTSAQLVWRKGAGGISAQVEHEEDPYGAVSGGHWADRPPQVWYRRTTLVKARIGTRFRKRVWTPVRDPARGVWFRLSVEEFELRGECKLVPLRALEERRARREVPRPLPLASDATARHASALLARLQGGAAAQEQESGAGAAAPLGARGRPDAVAAALEPAARVPRGDRADRARHRKANG